jgi:hypothetical protein
MVTLGRLGLLSAAGFGALFLLFVGFVALANTQGGYMDGGVQPIGPAYWGTSSLLFVAPILLLGLSILRRSWVPWAVVSLQMIVALVVTYIEVSYRGGAEEPNLMVGWAAALVVVVAGVTGWLLLSGASRRFYSWRP